MSPSHGDTPESLLRNADAAMHAAKSDGRGQIRHYDESLNRDAAEKVLLETELRAALELGEQIFMVYQPQVDTRTGNIAGVEALVRWNHPELGNISPVKFIPVAESSGLIIALGDLILRKVNEDAVSAGEHFPDNVAISINLSPIQFTQSNFVAELSETLKDIDSRFKIELELTEGVLMSDASTNLSKLKELKAIGFDLAIDDFGTGYSSLSYLRNFPIDTLKIDRSFVVDIGNEGGDGIVKAILSLSNALGLRTVAEGVETVEQSRFLCKNGCTLIQGYLLAKPLTIEDFVKVAKNNFTHQLGIRS
jgi:EAL domain-containing protein (putative c-di-GMP-specific phosphodiesterase class I)